MIFGARSMVKLSLLFVKQLLMKKSLFEPRGLSNGRFCHRRKVFGGTVLPNKMWLGRTVPKKYQ